jgi:20S proteasome subunit beta 2
MLSANLRLQELNSGRKARVITAVKMAKQHLFQYQGYIGAYLLIGGYDFTGPHLYMVSANGTDIHLPFHADGSGSYNAMAVLERDYKFDMSVSLLFLNSTYSDFRLRRAKIWSVVRLNLACMVTTFPATHTT